MYQETLQGAVLIDEARQEGKSLLEIGKQF